MTCQSSYDASRRMLFVLSTIIAMSLVAVTARAQQYYDEPSYHEQQYAQQPYGTPAQPKPTALQKLDHIGKSVKRRINRAFGVQPADHAVAPAPIDTRYEDPFRDIPRQQSDLPARYRHEPADHRVASRQSFQSQQPQRVQLQQYSGDPSHSLQPPVRPGARSEPSLQPGNYAERSATNFRQSVPVMPASTRPLNAHSTGPLGDVPHGPLDGPVIAGTRLGSAHVTATEHALNLQRENELLKTSHETLLAENRRLQQQLRSTQDLLKRMQTAMGDANQELETLVDENRTLQQKITDLETEQKRQLYNADRTMQVIRQELDDVLMREISLNGR